MPTYIIYINKFFSHFELRFDPAPDPFFLLPAEPDPGKKRKKKCGRLFARMYPVRAERLHWHFIPYEYAGCTYKYDRSTFKS